MKNNLLYDSNETKFKVVHNLNFVENLWRSTSYSAVKQNYKLRAGYDFDYASGH